MRASQVWPEYQRTPLLALSWWPQRDTRLWRLDRENGVVIVGTSTPSNRRSTIPQCVVRQFTRLQRFVQGSVLEMSTRAWRMPPALAPMGLALCAGLLGPLLLLHVGLLAPTDSGLTNLGFDAERVLLIDRIFCALLGGFIGASLSGRRVAGAVGGLLFYLFVYLLPFAQHAAHPGVSPTGQRQMVIASAYLGVLLTLCSLGILSAGVGAAVGGAAGELVIAPVWSLWAAWLRRIRHEGPRLTAGTFIRPLLILAAGIGLVVMIIAGAGGVVNALTYGPTTGIYAPVRPITSPRPTPVSHGLGPIEGTHGTLEQGTYVSSALGGTTRSYYVYLPPSYSTNRTERYPTIYLLHGSPGDPRNWMFEGQAPQSEDSLVAAGKMRDAILVTADGRGPVYRFSEWANSADGRQRMEDAVVKDLVRYIDHHYRTRPDAADRMIAGLSEGGFGAVNIALHHPDLFSVAISAGGYFTAEGPVFGRGPLSVSYRAYNSPLLYISTPAGKQALSRLQFVIGDGKDDGHFYADAMTFARKLESAHANVTVIEVTGGHSWRNWADIFAQAMQTIERPQGAGATHT
jgi:enterochelin esterase-like enzyme